MNGRSNCKAILAALTVGALLMGGPPSPALAKEARLSEAQKVRHLLDRVGFGPRPGDVERVLLMGRDEYLDRQLRPESVPDDRAEAGLRRFATLNAPTEDLTERFRAGIAATRQRGQTPESLQQARREYQSMLAEVAGDLQAAKVYRAVESQRQLFEVMVDFWTNHFNVDIRKGAARAWKTADDRDVVRAHALGRFRDLLGASAKSPAMLVYLDNARNTAPAAGNRGGLNENYARELMELHTLGVDGGYTQKDVVEVARCFTGWTVDPRTGAFAFAPRRHDNGEKTVLGRKIPAGGGIADGERALDILASHPATARHIARKLCVRFVSDDPPASVVSKAAKAFQKTDGDIAAVVRAIVTAPEFYSPKAYRAKVKSPFEYVVSAVRALDGHILPRGPRGAMSPIRQIAVMGEPLFQRTEPTGYPEDSRTWVSAGALVARLNFAVSLAAGRVAGVALPPLAAGAGDQIRNIAPDGFSEATRATMEKHAAAPGTLSGAALELSLALGSPEFQRR